jgi:riboflavin synthase
MSSSALVSGSGDARGDHHFERAGVTVFTGLVQDLGTVAAAERDGDGTRMVIATALAPEIGDGDSVAVNGVCLTATAVDRAAGSFAVDVMRETLARSSLGGVEPGGTVNLEL